MFTVILADKQHEIQDEIQHEIKVPDQDRGKLDKDRIRIRISSMKYSTRYRPGQRKSK